MLFTDVSTERAVRALEEAGFQVVRQGKHVVLSDGEGLVTVPRAKLRRTVALKFPAGGGNVPRC